MWTGILFENIMAFEAATNQASATKHGRGWMGQNQWDETNSLLAKTELEANPSSVDLFDRTQHSWMANCLLVMRSYEQMSHRDMANGSQMHIYSIIQFQSNYELDRLVFILFCKDQMLGLNFFRAHLKCLWQLAYCASPLTYPCLVLKS